MFREHSRQLHHFWIYVIASFFFFEIRKLSCKAVTWPTINPKGPLGKRMLPLSKSKQIQSLVTFPHKIMAEVVSGAYMLEMNKYAT